ncbi:LOW QUALITY PROTEIN: GPI transamidase component PIG-S [Hydra vulgaris]|uniref:LOW QUALITY PROTEIN: GPI transamidase component PIG-S n=1 Tax=Hydra vulgaris TaxID=6087 RepID=UPI0032EA39BA
MDYPQAFVSIVVFCIYIFVGVPVWWNTTKVYRASLPNEKINVLQNASIKLHIRLNIQSSVYEESELKEVAAIVSAESINDQVIWSVNVAIAQTNAREKYCEQYENSSELTYNIFIDQDHLNKKFIKIYCQTTSSVIISLSEKISSSNLEQIVRETIDDLTRNSYFLSNKSSLSYNNPMPPSSGYHITFTLAVSNPADFLPFWDIEVSINNYLKPMLQKFNFLGPFKVSSQILYYVDLGVNPFVGNDSFYFRESKLPQLINPIESRLASYVNTDPILNFVIYVPPKKYSPLHIRKSKNSKVGKISSFYSPRWGGGGIAIYNPTKVNEQIATQDYMGVFIEQFKLLVGIKSYFTDNNEIFSRVNLLIEKTFENLRTCLSTISSLSKLLDKIANIVIKDEIKELVYVAVLNVERSISFLRVGDIENAHLTSKEAFRCSEKAFYDSSLLALLYFPDDQKYAIYVLLILPISLPVIMSFFRAVKSFFKYQEKDV